jgi:excinuclease UvrABC ATPase subunit
MKEQKINNFVAKHARHFNKAAVFTDKKKAKKKGYTKHKKGSNWSQGVCLKCGWQNRE